MGKLSLKNKNHKLVPTATSIYQYFCTRSLLFIC